MSDYTPITSEVRECYVSDHRYADGSFFESQRAHEAEFNRWLNGVRADEREKCAQAILAAAYTLTSQDAGAVALSIKRQAARIARSGGDA